MTKGGNRSNGAKKQVPELPANEDTSYIIFGDGNSQRRKKKPEQSSSSTSNDLNGGAHTPASDAQQKPDTKKLIGGASWTGKLPVNILSEHCQKQRWAKPEYTMVFAL